MRLAGRISGWNDARGYGFVVPHDGGERAFVHVKAFPSGSRRPVEGDLISYEASKDSKGRTNAIEVRFAGQLIGASRASHKLPEPRKPSLPLPRSVIGLAFLLAVVAGLVFGIVRPMIAGAYGAFSAVSYIAYYLDKTAAQEYLQRVPESLLHWIDLFGGWPGALVAQQQFRHKTRKTSFQWVFWATVITNLFGAAALSQR